MLNKKTLIYLGAILLWQSPSYGGTAHDAIEKARDIYNEVFNDNDND